MSISSETNEKSLLGLHGIEHVRLAKVQPGSKPRSRCLDTLYGPLAFKVLRGGKPSLPSMIDGMERIK
eukprot:1138153-Pelagomonas_calceolata.AAC.1